MIRQILTNTLDVLYPPQCFFCSLALSEGNYLCDSCEVNLDSVEFPFCDCCGEPFEGAISDVFDCPNCKGLPMKFDFAIAALNCSAEAKQLVHELKYRKQLYVAKIMARLMVHKFEEDERFLDFEWLVVPVPLHWRRRMRRGFNQSEELATHFCKMLDLPLMNLLKRTRRTGTQTVLGRKKRIQNLKGSFVKNKACSHQKYKNILLLDDVLTTGSTAHECAKVIKQGSDIEQVAVLTLMRG